MSSFETQDEIKLTNWNRSGLPGWAYFSEELFELEQDTLFRRHWQFVCHVNSLKKIGDYVSIDMAGERGFVILGDDKVIRAFHNLCIHRGSRVVAQAKGTCKKSIVCPFHGWTYNLDGTLRGVVSRDTFPDMNLDQMGLKPLEMDIWNGLIFIKFKSGEQPKVSTIMARFEKEIKHYSLKNMVPVLDSEWSETLEVNWKSVRDVDNEGYHVRQAHPGLHDLYGQNYYDEPFSKGTSRSIGVFNDKPSKKWSVKNYLKFLPKNSSFPVEMQGRWLYAGMFPNLVFGFYPDSVIYYLEVPISATKTVQRGGVLKFPEETRELKISRYLSGRIDRDTAKEDQMLTIWSSEATKSSAYTGVIFSDLEYGVKSYHDHLRKLMPVLKLNSEPASGRLAEVNTDMLGQL